MSDLETRLAQARKRQCGTTFMAQQGFDAGVAFMRQVVAEKDADLATGKKFYDAVVDKIAEKDAEIARLKAEPRKVSDAQRKAIKKVLVLWAYRSYWVDETVRDIAAIIESPAD